MSKSFDHDRVSELLPGFLDGTLAQSDAAAIEEHLSACESCRQEAEGVRRLRAPIDPMTASERLSLEHRVMAGIADDAPATVSEMPRRSGMGARVAQVLGAAAAVAVIGTIVYFGGGLGSGGDDEATSGADSVAEEEFGAVEDRERRRESSGKGRVSNDVAAATEGDLGAASGGGAGDAAGTTSFKNAPEPRFSVADDPFTPAGLQRLGESSLASVRFASVYSSDDADGRNTLLEQLVASAEASSGAGVASQVDECGAQVLDTEDPTIPTFGYLGELDGEPVLVLGFAWSRRASGPLDRYMVWAWERGSCAAAVDFVEGRIETAG